MCLDERLGDPGDQNDTTYSLDEKWHLNDEGYTIVAEIVKAATRNMP